MTRLVPWIPTFTMLLVSLISYIDRNTLALLAPTILKETRLTGQQYGFVISAFSVAYMIGNPLWGRLLDRFGLRAGMTVAVSFWTLASAAHAFAGGFFSFAAARAALGFGEGATFPGGLRTVVQTLPATRRSRGIAVAYSGGSLGAIVTPLIVTPVALAWGWRAAFLFTGLIGALWLAAWLGVSRRPDIRAPRPAAQQVPLPAPRNSDPRLWSYMAAYALCALPLAIVLYGAALFLAHVYGKSQGQIGQVLWIPPLGWEAGYFFWGWVLDRSARDGALSIARFRVLFGLMTALSLPLALAPRAPSFPAVMAQMFLAMFVGAGFIVATVAYATHVYSSAHAGLIAGLGAGAWSALVACIMPVFGRLFDRRQWDAAFLLAALCPVAGYLVWLALNRRRASVPPAIA